MKKNIIYSMVIVAILLVNIIVYYTINHDVVTSSESEPVDVETEYSFNFEGTNLEPLTLQRVIDGTIKYRNSSVEYMEQFLWNSRHTNWGD